MAPVSTVPTIRIRSEDHPDGVVIINLSDFDPATMEAVDGDAPAQAETPLAARAAALLAGSVSEVRARLVDADDQLLHAAAQQESEAAKPRKGVLDAIAEVAAAREVAG